MNPRRVVKLLTSIALLCATLLLLTPSAHADIFKVESVGATCSGAGSAGGGLCSFNGTTFVPFSLSALVGGGIGFSDLQGFAPGAGTINFVVVDDFGSNSGFTFVFTNGVADNASCQLAGGTAIFSGCSIVDSLGHTTSLGAAQIDHFFVPAANISFSGTGLLGNTFKLEFVSMQGLTGLTTPQVPEPSTLSFLATALFGFVGLAALKKALLA